MSITRVSIDLSEDLYKSVKIFATLNDLTIKDCMIEALKDRIGGKAKNGAALSAKTKKIIDKALIDEKKGKLLKYKSFKDVLKDIDK